MSDMALYIGLDVGGSAMKAGVVDDKARPLSRVTLTTQAERGQAFGLAHMCETIRLAAQTAGVGFKDIKAIGIATPGTMDIPAGIILDPPNLRPWKNVPVRQYVWEAFGLPTAFQNDANAAAFGEYWGGAGQGTHSLILFTLGTGIGGGIIMNDAVVEGEHSHGGELGHTRIEITRSRKCGCGRFGCLEAYSSATAVVQRAREALKEHPDGSPTLAAACAHGKIEARDVFLAAENDELAAKIVSDTAFYLAVGAVNAMHTIDPDMIVFGGGMIGAGEKFLEQIRQHVHDMAFPVPAARTRICYAKLGADAGFIGAAACARQLYLRSTTVSSRGQEI
jgi:glucokinase